jgi:hypothetical protein
MNHSRTERIVYYTLVIAGLLFILLSNPFLKIPYDPWEHLIRIASLHDEGKSFVFWPGDERAGSSWHAAWAHFFNLVGINDLFGWAKIIHVFQFVLAAVIIFYFSKTALAILNNNKETISLRILAFFSAVLWFVGNGTFSIAYQQAWIVWYSVTYQGFTIPLFWYCTTLTLKIFYCDLTSKKKLFYVVQIAFLSALIAKAHSMELLYYLIHLSVLFLMNMRGLSGLRNRRSLLIYVPVLFLALFFVVRYFVSQQSPLLALLSSNQTLAQMARSMHTMGQQIILNKWNRFPDSFSEMALLSLIAASLFRILYASKKGKAFSMNVNVFDYLLGCSFLFFLIPTVPFLAGLGGHLVHQYVVYRFFFAAPWFVFLPFLIRILFTKKKEREESFHRIVIFNALTVILVIILSHYFFTNTLSRNARSILISLDGKKVGVQYSKEDTETLRTIIKSHDKKIEGKPNIYYTRGDLAYLVRGIFRKYVYSSRLELWSKKSFADQKYNLIDVAVPEDFPKDQETFQYFSFDKKE